MAPKTIRKITPRSTSADAARSSLAASFSIEHLSSPATPVRTKDLAPVVEAIGGLIGPSPLRRDFNLIRAILIEAERPGEHAFAFEGFDHGMVQSHLVLLIETGFLHGSIMREGNSSTHALVERLAWFGHDLLALIKDDALWKKARRSVLDAQGRAHSEVLVDWLKAQKRAALAHNSRK